MIRLTLKPEEAELLLTIHRIALQSPTLNNQDVLNITMMVSKIVQALRESAAMEQALANIAEQPPAPNPSVALDGVPVEPAVGG